MASAEGEDWLPPGWIVEGRVRSSGASAGSTDKVDTVSQITSIFSSFVWLLRNYWEEKIGLFVFPFVFFF